MYNKNIKYICVCKKYFVNFQTWLQKCDCKYCLCKIDRKNIHLKIRIDNINAVGYDFGLDSFTIEKLYETQEDNLFFTSKDRININVKFNTQKQYINYLIKYSENLIFM